MKQRAGGRAGGGLNTLRSTFVAVAVAFALVAISAPAFAPALDDLSPAASAAARPCLVGSSGDCVVPVVCVREPCFEFP